MDDEMTGSLTGHRKRHVAATLAGLIFVAALVVLLGKGLTLNPNSSGNAFEDQEALDFKAKWIQGQELVEGGDSAGFTLKEFRGKAVILNFWASWCVSCREEAKEMELFWQKYKEQGVIVLGVAIQDTEESARKFADYFGKTYILGMDVDGKISIDYGVTGVPETFFIDYQGIVRDKVTGPVDLPMMEEKLKGLRKPNNA